MKRIFRFILLVFMVLTIMFTQSIGINIDREQVYASVKPQKKLASSNENEMHFQTTETTYGFYENSEGKVITLPISEYSANSEELEPAAIVPVCEGITISVTGLNSEGYTESGVTVTYTGLYRSATYSIDNSTAQSFNSGTVFYGMGSYTIRVTCICGEIKTRYFTINGSCVVADSDDYKIQVVGVQDNPDTDTDVTTSGDPLPSAYKVTTTFSYGDDIYGHYKTKLDFTSPAIADDYDIVLFFSVNEEFLNISSVNNIGTLKTEYYYSIYSNGVLESDNNYDYITCDFEVEFVDNQHVINSYGRYLFVDTNMIYTYIDNVNNKKYVIDRAIVTLDFDVQSCRGIVNSSNILTPIYEIPNLCISSYTFFFYRESEIESYRSKVVTSGNVYESVFSIIVDFINLDFLSLTIDSISFLVIGIINCNYSSGFENYYINKEISI